MLLNRFEVSQKDETQLVLKFNESRIVLQYAPFRIDIVIKGEPVVSINGRGLLMFEHLRLKKQ